MLKAIRREIKLLIAISVALALGFSIIDFIALSFLKQEVVSRLQLEVSFYKEMLFLDPSYPLPEYVKLCKLPPPDGWELVSKVGDKYLFVNVERVLDLVKRFSITLFLWEAVTLFITISFVYLLIKYFFLKEKQSKELVRFFFMFFSHKLGNFLAMNKLNLEILRDRCSGDKVIDRLLKAHELLEQEFKSSLRYVSSMKNAEQHESLVKLDLMLSEILKKISDVYPYINLTQDIEPVSVKAVKAELESLMFILFENAFKYAAKKVRVSLQRIGSKGFRLLIVNDVGTIPSGSGLGLQLASTVVKKLGWKLERKFINGEFEVLVSNV